jgi:hypothetical protein
MVNFQMKTDPIAVSVNHAALLLGVSTPTIYRLLKSGELHRLEIEFRLTLITMSSIRRLTGKTKA